MGIYNDRDQSVQSVHQLPTDTAGITAIKMKVTALLLVTLGLVAHISAHEEYHLQCSREEMGIRWPSYKSNSDYYVCHRLGERPMIISCNAGEVFTFVLQVCTSPSRYIPAPTLDVLPTSSSSNANPPIFAGTTKPDHHGMEIPHPPTVYVESHKPPTLTPISGNTEVEVPNKEAEEKPLHPAKPHKPDAKPPMPPTPAPTPPVVDTTTIAKKPKAPLGKKPSSPKKTSKKPSSAAKKPSSKPKKDAKKPAKKSAKKPAKPAKAAKKNSKGSKAPKSPKAAKPSKTAKSPKASKATKTPAKA